MGFLSDLGDVVGIATGALGLAKGLDDSGEDRAQANRLQDIQLQKDFAQKGIRWKVADAKKAGLHPLSVLGSQGASYQPVGTYSDSSNNVSDILNSGQSINRSLRAQQTPIEKQISLANLDNLKATTEKDQAIAGYYTALAAKARNDDVGAKAFPYGSNPGNDLTIMKPDEVTRARPEDRSVTAGDHPFWMRQEVSPGTFIEVPRADNPSESLESGGAVVATMLNPYNWKVLGKRIQNNILGLGDMVKLWGNDHGRGAWLRDQGQAGRRYSRNRYSSRRY